jgi:hypothetical protein
MYPAACRPAAGQPGHAARRDRGVGEKVFGAARQSTGYVKVVKVSQGRYAATGAGHAAGEVARGTITAEHSRHGDQCRFSRDHLSLLPPRTRHQQGCGRIQAGSKSCSCCQSRSAFAWASYASSPWITWISTRGVIQGWRSASRTRRCRDPEVEALAHRVQVRCGRARGVQEAPAIEWLAAGHRRAGQQPRFHNTHATGTAHACRGDRPEALTLLNWRDARVRIAEPGPASCIHVDSGAKSGAVVT